MNDRLTRHQDKFFSSNSESIQFWNGLFYLLNCRDFEMASFYIAPKSEHGPIVNFKIEKLCDGYLNVITLDGRTNYLWIGLLPQVGVHQLYNFIQEKISGKDGSDGNRFFLLESFLRFNFNRRSINAMMNWMLAFFIRFKDEILQKSAFHSNQVEGITDKIVLQNYSALLKFMRGTVLPQVLSDSELADLAESDSQAFPFSYTVELSDIQHDDDLDIDLPAVISVCSYVALPENIIYMSVHRELEHTLNDYFGRPEHELVVEVSNSDFTYFNCRTVVRNHLLSVKLKLVVDANSPITPCCLESQTAQHRCFLFDGLDVLKAIYIKILKDPVVENGLRLHLRLLTTHAMGVFGGIIAHIKGHPVSGEFNIDEFYVDEPEHEWVLYSGEIETLITTYVNDLAIHNNWDMDNLYDTIYIGESNVIQSFSEILNIVG